MQAECQRATGRWTDRLAMKSQKKDQVELWWLPAADAPCRLPASRCWYPVDVGHSNVCTAIV
eukprot:3576507-Amphidinium_carterae.3